MPYTTQPLPVHQVHNNHNSSSQRNSRRPSVIKLERIEDKDYSQIIRKLPTDHSSLESFVIDVLVSYHDFKERVKEVLHQTVTENVSFKEKLSKLEKRVGIEDSDTSERFHELLKAIQDENETHLETITNLRENVMKLEKKNTELVRENEKKFQNLHAQYQSQLLNVAQLSAEAENFSNSMNDEKDKRTSLSSSISTEIKQKRPLSRKGSVAGILENNNEEFNNAQQQNQRESRQKHQTVQSPNENNYNGRHGNHSSHHYNSHQIPGDDDEDPNEIIFVRDETGKMKIKAAKFEALTKRLINGSTSDFHYLTSFLLTYRLYITPVDLISLLQTFYLDPKLVQRNDTRLINSPVRIRIINTIKHWMENHWSDFQDDDDLLKKTNEFISIIEEDKLKSLLVNLISKKLNTPNEVKERNATVTSPRPILPKNFKRNTAAISTSISLSNAEFKSVSGGNISISIPSLEKTNSGTLISLIKSKNQQDSSIDDVCKVKFSELDPIEVARQLTLIEFELFASIRPREFVDLSWMKEDKETRAPGIIRMAQWSNHVIHWLTSEIISAKDLKSRITTYEKAVLLALQLEKLHNFNGVKEVLAALQSSSVFRLRKTKEGVSSKVTKVYEDLCKLVSSEMNYKQLRNMIGSVGLPLIPFPGVYQGDLVFLETCLKNHVDGGMVNYPKMEKLSSYILEIMNYQQAGYSLEPVPEIQDYIKMYQVLTDDEAYGLSLTCEPRT